MLGILLYQTIEVRYYCAVITKRWLTLLIVGFLQYMEVIEMKLYHNRVFLGGSDSLCLLDKHLSAAVSVCVGGTAVPEPIPVQRFYR